MLDPIQQREHHARGSTQAVERVAERRRLDRDERHVGRLVQCLDHIRVGRGDLGATSQGQSFGPENGRRGRSGHTDHAHAGAGEADGEHAADGAGAEDGDDHVSDGSLIRLTYFHSV